MRAIEVFELRPTPLRGVSGWAALWRALGPRDRPQSVQLDGARDAIRCANGSCGAMVPLDEAACLLCGRKADWGAGKSEKPAEKPRRTTPRR